MKYLPQPAIEKIGYYVYLLKDPESHQVFYVGKGKGSRILNHENFLDKLGLKEGKKISKIKEIRSRRTDNNIEYQILRHGLTEKEAFEVESSVIDLLGLSNLTNEVRSYDSSDRGISDLNEILIKYTAEKADILIPVVLINLNSTFKIGMTSAEIYSIIKGKWKLNFTNASKYKYVFAVYRGIIREIFEVKIWEKSDLQGRYQFEGNIVKEPKMRDLYINKSVKHYIAVGNQNPIKYIN